MFQYSTKNKALSLVLVYLSSWTKETVQRKSTTSCPWKKDSFILVWKRSNSLRPSRSKVVQSVKGIVPMLWLNFPVWDHQTSPDFEAIRNRHGCM